MERAEKVKFVTEMKERLERSGGTFLVDYQGLDVEAMTQLRKELRKAEAEFFVVKNRLLKRAADGTSTALLEEYMVGPSALTLAYSDVAASAKALVEFAKDHEQLKIKAGQIAGKFMDPDAIRKLAELPSKEVLLAQAVGALQAVPGSFVRVLNAVLVSLLNVLKAIENQKQE